MQFRRVITPCLAFMAAPFVQCTSPVSVTERVDSQVVTRTTLSGVEIFAEESGNVSRYLCSKAAIDALPEGASALRDAATVRASCKQSGSLDVATFRAKWSSAYIEYANFTILGVHDASGELNEQETIALSDLVRSLGWSFADPKTNTEAYEGAALRETRGAFLNVLDTVFDSAAPSGAKLGGGSAQQGAAMHLLGEGVEVATVRLEGDANGAPQVLVLGLKGATALVDALDVTSNDDCAAVESVKALGANGSTNVGATHATGDRWALDGAPSSVLSVTVTATKRVAGDCTLTVSAHRAELAEKPASDDARDLKMKTLMARRDHRSWHYLWHGIRNGWLRMSTAQRAKVRAMGPAWGREQEPAKAPSKARGEEFLHMHRAMLAMLKDHLGDQMYEPWEAPPPADDASFPLPPDNDDPQAYAQLVAWDKQAKDSGFLKGKSLSEYGEWLETTLHNNMHMRWADWRVGSKFQQLEPANVFTPGKPDADVFANDYLGSTYASHVNPIFYRLHGYVNNRIEDWLAANGYSEVSDDAACVAPTCYKWRGVWDGAFPHRITSDTTVSVTPSEAPTPEALQGLAQDRSLVRLIHANSNMSNAPTEGQPSSGN